MRGYFAIGVERISKPMNLGSLMRSAHAFGASFFFTIAADFDVREVRLSDTAESEKHLPLYTHDHPSTAAYVFGPERGDLSEELTARCDHLIRIPTKFCVNVGIAGAIVMYDRLISRGRFAERPLNPRAEPESLPGHVRGAQVIRGGRGRRGHG